MVGTINEVPTALSLTLTDPDQDRREPSGKGGAEAALGQVCVGRPRIGARGVNFGQKHVLGELRDRRTGLLAPLKIRISV